MTQCIARSGDPSKVRDVSFERYVLGKGTLIVIEFGDGATWCFTATELREWLTKNDRLEEKKA